jgi:UDP-2,3-diacylglucosamine hydrolase
MVLPESKVIYFVSDSHLGIPDRESSLVREKLLVKWLDQVKIDASEIFILGDLFDFWFEYGSVVPKGYTRLLGKISELTDSGIAVNFFKGNHDIWDFGYFTSELGMNVFEKPLEREINGKTFFIAHGDGLGPGDYGYRFVKKVFSCKINQRLFAMLHPSFGAWLAGLFSKKSRKKNAPKDLNYSGPENERLYQFCQQKLKEKHFDFFVMGHRHLPLDLELDNGSRYISVGDWVTNFSYAVFDGNVVSLRKYEEAGK